jgi:F-type H+-transporting ATPase subunit b
LRRPLSLLLLLLFFALGAWANEEGGHHAEPPIIYKWINFGILSAGIAYIAVKTGGPFFRARREEIARALSGAERIKIESEKQVAEINKRISNLDGELAALRASAREEMEAERARSQAETEAMAAKLKAQAAEEIESAAKQAAGELRAYVSKLALELAAAKIKARMDAPSQGRLVASFVSDLRRTGTN